MTPNVRQHRSPLAAPDGGVASAAREEIAA
jgi:hypothetical protein